MRIILIFVLLIALCYASNLNVTVSSYFDGELFETVVLPNTDIVMVGEGKETFGQQTQDYNQVGKIGEGRIVLLSKAGVVKKVVRMGKSVRDISVDDVRQRIVVVGEKEDGADKRRNFVASLSYDLKTLHWAKQEFEEGPNGNKPKKSNGYRVDVAPNGDSAVLLKYWIHFFDANGNRKGTFKMITKTSEDKNDNHGIEGYNIEIEDIAIDNNNFYVVGSSQRCGTFTAGLFFGYPVDKFNQDNYVGKSVFDRYQWSCASLLLGAHGGDFFIYRVIKGRDNGLYILGQGIGETQFLRNPVVDINNIRKDVNNIAFDDFTKVNNLRPNNAITYYAQFDEKGNWKKGQNLVSRETNGKSNGMDCTAISVNEKGETYVGCKAESFFPGRKDASVNSVKIGNEKSKDAFFQKLNSAWTNRSVSTAFTNDGDISSTYSAYGQVAVVGNTKEDLTSVTANAPEKKKKGSFFAIYSIPVPAPKPPAPGTVINFKWNNSNKFWLELRIAPHPRQTVEFDCGTGKIEAKVSTWDSHTFVATPTGCRRPNAGVSVFVGGREIVSRYDGLGTNSYVV